MKLTFQCIGSALLLLPIAVAPPAASQEPSSLILAGLDSVDAQVDVSWDNPDKATTQARLQTVFELELRKHGIVVSTGANNYLYFALALVSSENGNVSYAHAVHLREPGFPRRTMTKLIASAIGETDSVSWQRFLDAYLAHPSPWVTTWEGPQGVVRVGRRLLAESLDRKAVAGAQAFANAFLASRPR